MPSHPFPSFTSIDFEIEMGRFLLGVEGRSLTLAGLIEAVAGRIIKAGIPLERLVTGLNARHPEILIQAVIWSATGGIRERSLSFADLADEPLDTPFGAMRFSGVARIREPLSRGEVTAFPMLERLRADGHTDYLAHRIGSGGRISYWTKAPGGWSDAQVEALDRLVPSVGAAIELREKEAAIASLLHVYLGADAAVRVLAGEVRRGGGTTLRCVTWFCDMRGFTEMSDRLTAPDVVRLLDAVFERVGGAITDHGGHILKFIGDAVLAVFPVADGPSSAARAALECARAAQSALVTLNSDGRDPRVEIGIALHVGEVFYGNIGARERLDFTVIGSTVNEVCRIESLCKTLGANVLCSQEFAEAIAMKGLVHLGEHALKGVARRVRVYGLAEDYGH